MTCDHRRLLDNRCCAQEFHPDLPYIALHAFLANWLHPALAPCFDGLEIMWAYIFWLQLWRYPLRILNTKTLLGSAPDSAPPSTTPVASHPAPPPSPLPAFSAT
ncbi:hypothetical protein B0H14DRAFT_2596667 [Mycena olivaceomarginata]|nr:hypothetical protein B0H14DRAFT_2596667 [Mycena olivaceomarginata]